MALALTTADSYFGSLTDMVRGLYDGPLTTEVDSSVTAYAIVRQSRWVVLCPWCPNAMLASEQDHRFFCNSCANAVVGGKWVPVEWPPNSAEIELHLGVRAVPETRNWERGESIGDLAVENAEHGASGLVIGK